MGQARIHKNIQHSGFGEFKYPGFIVSEGLSARRIQVPEFLVQKK